MTRYFLTCAKIEGFRGINNEGDPLTVKFRTDAVNSIFAANGMGKSSLFEAISYAITGTLPKLDRMVAAESAKEYYCNQFHTKKRAEILLTFSPDDGSEDVEIKVVRDANGRRTVSSPTGYGTPELLLSALADETALLDHQTFIKFLLDSPLERGKAFSSLLGLSKLAEVRQGLSALANTTAFNTDSNIKVLEAQVILSGPQLLHTQLALKQDYLGLVGTPLTEPIDATNAAAQAVAALAGVPLLQPLCTNLSLDKVDFGKISTTIKAAEGGEDQERLKKVIGDIATLEGLAPLPAEVGERSALLDLCREKDAALAITKGASLRELYAAVKQVFDDGSWTDRSKCPACESNPIEPPFEFVSKQLHQFETADEAAKEVCARLEICPMCQQTAKARNKTLDTHYCGGQYPQQNHSISLKWSGNRERFE